MACQYEHKMSIFGINHHWLLKHIQVYVLWITKAVNNAWEAASVIILLKVPTLLFIILLLLLLPVVPRLAAGLALHQTLHLLPETDHHHKRREIGHFRFLVSLSHWIEIPITRQSSQFHWGKVSKPALSVAPVWDILLETDYHLAWGSPKHEDTLDLSLFSQNNSSNPPLQRMSAALFRPWHTLQKLPETLWRASQPMQQLKKGECLGKISCGGFDRNNPTHSWQTMWKQTVLGLDTRTAVKKCSAMPLSPVQWHG